jgi:hypothetical protein
MFPGFGKDIGSDSAFLSFVVKSRTDKGCNDSKAEHCVIFFFVGHHFYL